MPCHPHQRCHPGNVGPCRKASRRPGTPPAVAGSRGPPPTGPRTPALSGSARVPAHRYTADILDVESGAATPGECPGWAKAALASYHQAPPGPASGPGVYMNLSTMTSVVNALAAAKITGIGLWIAHWDDHEPADAAQIMASVRPVPGDRGAVHLAWVAMTFGVSAQLARCGLRLAGPSRCWPWARPGPAVVTAQKRLQCVGCEDHGGRRLRAGDFAAVRRLPGQRACLTAEG